jgi:hypothetical protein
MGCAAARAHGLEGWLPDHIFDDPIARKSARPDIGENAFHLCARFIGDDAPPRNIFAVFRRVRYRGVHTSNPRT